MREILKSKTMMGFMIFMIGIILINGVQTKKYENNKKIANDTYVVLK